MTGNMCVALKFKNADTYLPLTYSEKVKDVNAGNDSNIYIHCVTTNKDFPLKDQYNFTLTLDSAVIPFNISDLISTLQTIEYSGMVKELENKIDEKYYQASNGQPLTGAKLCSK